MQQALIWLIVLIAVLGAAYMFFGSNLSGTDAERTQITTEIAGDMLKGDYGSAAQAADEVFADKKSSAEIKARALALTLSAEYRVTGSEASMLDEIALMKQYITDPDVSAETRVRLINALAAQYQISGGNKNIFDAMFAGAPFDSFRATGGVNPDIDARLSVRQLLEWSYATMPTAYAAIAISRWYSEQALFIPDMSSELKKENAEKSEEFLKKAEEANATDAQRIASYDDSVVFIYYRHWRAIIYGRLAAQIGEPYASQYEKEYAEVLEFQDAHTNPMAQEFTLYTRLFFASKLRADGKRDAATAQLDELAARMNAIDLSVVNAFVSFLRIEKSERPNGATYRNLVSSNFPLSPAFEAAVQRVISVQ